MKDAEDEAFEEIERRQGAWGGGFKAKQAMAADKMQEPVAHTVIAGALFDFMGYLTSRKERIVLSAADDAAPAVDAIRDFAKMRGLSLDDAQVRDWNTTPPQREWVGLTPENILALFDEHNLYGSKLVEFARAVKTKIKDKNT